MNNPEENLPESNFRNIDLSVFAEEASVDIGNALAGGKFESSAVQYLSELLMDYSIDHRHKKDDSLNYSCIHEVLLAHAISGGDNPEKYFKERDNNFEKFWGRRPTTDMLSLQLYLGSKELSNFENLSKEKQENLMYFCINLCKESINHADTYKSGANHKFLPFPQPF